MLSFFYVSFVSVAVGLVLAALVIYWDYRRDQALIAAGLQQPLDRAHRFLAWGLVTTGTGAALFVGSFWVGMPEAELAGLVIAFLGIALLLFSILLGHRVPTS